MTISYKSYLCYALCYLPNNASTFLVIYILLRLKISDYMFFLLFFFFRFLKICEGGNPEATICFAGI